MDSPTSLTLGLWRELWNDVVPLAYVFHQLLGKELSEPFKRFYLDLKTQHHVNYPPTPTFSFHTSPIPSIAISVYASHKYYHAKIPPDTQPHSDPNIAWAHNGPPPSRSIPPAEPCSHCNTQHHSRSHGPGRGTSSCGNHSVRPRAVAPREAGCSSSQGRWGCSPIGTILVLWVRTGIERMISWSWLWAGRFGPRRCLALCLLGRQRAASGVASVVGCRGVDLWAKSSLVGKALYFLDPDTLSEVTLGNDVGYGRLRVDSWQILFSWVGRRRGRRSNSFCYILRSKIPVNGRLNSFPRLSSSVRQTPIVNCKK